MKKTVIILIILVLICVVFGMNNKINKSKSITNQSKKIEKLDKEIANEKNINPNKYFERGMLKFNKHDYKGALDDFNEAKEMYAKLENLQVKREEKIKKEHPNVAISQKNPHMVNTTLYLYSARANERMRRYQEAINDYNEVLKVKPNAQYATKAIERLQRMKENKS